MISAAAIARDLGCGPAICAHLGALWDKSRHKASGTMNLLISHLFDTAAVAEVIWGHFLAPATKDLLERVSGGRGQRFFAWLCGIHGCGKATPASRSSTPSKRHAFVLLGWRGRRR